MNRRSSFGQMLAGSILAVCFLPVVLRAEGNVPVPDAQPAIAGMMATGRLTAVETTAGDGGLRVFLETSGKVDAQSFVLDSPGTRDFMTRLCEFLDFLIPRYEAEGKAHLTVALGCTGGQHRSVAVACALDRHLRERKIDVRVTHRDVARARRSDP